MYEWLKCCNANMMLFIGSKCKTEYGKRIHIEIEIGGKNERTKKQKTEK